jgi:hypothetical protein
MILQSRVSGKACHSFYGCSPNIGLRVYAGFLAIRVSKICCKTDDLNSLTISSVGREDFDVYVSIINALIMSQTVAPRPTISIHAELKAADRVAGLLLGVRTPDSW